MSEQLNELVISSISDFVSYIENEPKLNFYRGQTNKDHKIISSLGRELIKLKAIGYTDKELHNREVNLIRLFRVNSFEYHQNINIPDLELIALAQHHGLKTRLLDWTRSPLVGLYFAVEKNDNNDGVVYIYSFNNEDRCYDGKTALEVDIYKLEKDSFFIPLNSTNRVTVQQGVFLIFKDPISEFKNKNLRKLIINKDKKAYFKKELYKLGINRYVLFPNLDGLSSFLNWEKFEDK